MEYLLYFTECFLYYYFSLLLCHKILSQTSDFCSYVLLCRDMGYRAYEIEGASALLYRPFVSVYFGAAYLKWLSTYDGK